MAAEAWSCPCAWASAMIARQKAAIHLDVLNMLKKPVTSQSYRHSILRRLTILRGHRYSRAQPPKQVYAERMLSPRARSEVLVFPAVRGLSPPLSLPLRRNGQSA